MIGQRIIGNILGPKPKADKKSKNMDEYCDKCDYWRGTPNTFKNKKWVFVCDGCKDGYKVDKETKFLNKNEV